MPLKVLILRVMLPYPSACTPVYPMCQTPMSKDKLRAYQWEYAWQKRAPGCRKCSKAEHALLEEWHKQKCQLMEMEDLLLNSKAAFGQCICPPLLSFGSHADIKGLCVLTHNMITSGRSPMKSRHD